jgi:hypothetical protein
LRRHRDISAAPRRSATGTWQAITDLIADTLDQSPHINRDEIESAMATAATVGLPLVAAGHLDQHPLTLVADPVHCAISGTAALSFEENLNPIPGGGQANDFTLHLPTPTRSKTWCERPRSARPTCPPTHHPSSRPTPRPALRPGMVRSRTG